MVVRAMNTIVPMSKVNCVRAMDEWAENVLLMVDGYRMSSSIVIGTRLSLAWRYELCAWLNLGTKKYSDSTSNEMEWDRGVCEYLFYELILESTSKYDGAFHSDRDIIATDNQ